MSENSKKPWEIFNGITSRAIENTPRISSHPEDSRQVKKILETIRQLGGVDEIWKPELVGVVTEVKNYDLTDEQKRILEVGHNKEQSVYFLSESGLRMHIQWNDKKPSGKNADWSDFPSGFEVDDCIQIKGKGAMIKAVKRITSDEMNERIGRKYQG